MPRRRVVGPFPAPAGDDDSRGRLVETEQVSNVAVGYVIGAVLMIGAGLVEWFLGVDAENQRLEDLAAPLSAARTA